MRSYIVYSILYVVLTICSVAAADTAMIHSLSVGEVTGKLAGRSDIEPYFSALQQLSNMYCDPRGGVTKRPGTYYIYTISESYTLIEEVPAVPGVPGAGYTKYLIGINAYSGAKIVAMGKDDSTLDTTWGNSGYWDASPNLNPCYCMHQLSDGRVLVAHNYYKVSMIDTDGTTDTSWATGGTYTMHSSGVNVRSILEDSSGNFHFFGGVAGNTALYVYEKCDSDGTYLDGMTRDETKLWMIYSATWADDDKTRIIAGGSGVDAIAIPPTYTYPDYRWVIAVAIDPVTCTVDTDWTGNIPESPGYASYPYGYAEQLPVVKIFRTSDDGVVLYRRDTDTFCKILSDGSAIDTSWGTSGIVDLGATSFPPEEGDTPTQDGDSFYVITVSTVGGNHNVFSLVDSDGAITNTFDATGTGYYCVEVFNDQLLFGNSGYVELWDGDFTYISRFQVAYTNSVWWVIPDESTYDPDIPAVPGVPGLIVENEFGEGQLVPIRLIDFVASDETPYVVVMGNEHMTFLESD